MAEKSSNGTNDGVSITQAELDILAAQMVEPPKIKLKGNYQDVRTDAQGQKVVLKQDEIDRLIGKDIEGNSH